MSDYYYSEYYASNYGPTRTYYIKELDENSPKYPADKICSKVKLKEHQLTLLQKCIEFEKNKYIELYDNDVSETCTDISSQYGIIADKTGSGKSYVILALILINKYLERENRIIRNLGNYIKFTKKETFNECSCNIIVIPHNIKSQWITYIKSFSDNIKYYMIDTVKSLELCLKDWENEYKFYNAILVTGSFYKYLENYVSSNNIRVSRLIFDEADTCRIPSSKKIEASFYWFITASYKNIIFPYKYSVFNHITRNTDHLTNGIENNKFIKEIFKANLQHSNDVINRKIFDNLIIKNKDSYVDQSFNLPNIIHNTVLCKSPFILDLLDGIVTDKIINYIHAGDIQGAMDCVKKSNINTEENIINRILESYQIQINNINTKINCVNAIIYSNENDRTDKLTKLENDSIIVKNKLSMLKERLQTSQNECVICFDTIDVKTITKCCNSAYCFKCISEWLARNHTCPLCKQDIHFNSLYYVNNDIKEDLEVVSSKIENNSENYTKIENLIQLLSDNYDKNKKFLICSDYDNTFIEIEKILYKQKLKYEKLKGNNIQNTVDRYKNQDLNILLVNSKHYGSGMNLQNTTDIVLFHRLDSELEKQCIGRCQRFGRKQPLNVWYLLHKTELKHENDININEVIE